MKSFKLMLILCVLASLCSASLDDGVDHSMDWFLSFYWGQPQIYYTDSSTPQMTYKLDQSALTYLDTTNPSDVDFTVAYVLVPKSQWTTTLQNKFYDLETLQYSSSNRGKTLVQRINEEVGVSAVNVFGWQQGSQVNNNFNVQMPSVSKFQEYQLVLVGCAYRSQFLNPKLYCEVEDLSIGVYDCSDCSGLEVCALDYLYQDLYKQYFMQNFGVNQMCLVQGGAEHRFCTTTSDCNAMVTQTPDTALDLGEGIYTYKPARCDETNPTGNPAVQYLASKNVGSIGTCEWGAKTANIDCPPFFGYPSDYHVITTRGTYYSDFSGWGVKDGFCVLGECNTYASCYSLYASIFYDCVPSTKTDANQVVGYCSQIPYTTGLIEQRCTALEGAPASGYGWSVDENGDCVQVIPIESECSNSTECYCVSGQVAHCQIIQTEQGDIGKCICLDSPDPTPDIICGDGRCDPPTESASNCLVDCHCGDGVCQSEYGETFISCFPDCGSSGGGGGGEDNTLLYLAVLAVVLIGLFIFLTVVVVAFLYHRRKKQ